MEGTNLRVFDGNWAESAAAIQSFHEKKNQPTDLGQLLVEHNCSPKRASELRRVVGDRRLVDDRQPRPVALAHSPPSRGACVEFRLTYRYAKHQSAPAEFITGWCKGLRANAPESSQPCLIWATGFGDGDEPRLASILSRRIISNGTQNLAEFFYTKSGEIAETTCTRLLEDMESVLDYVAETPQIDKNRVCLIGISICGFLAARLAQHDARVSSLILVAPPFDIIDMLDGFRRHYLRGSRSVPTFDDFLKARNGLRIADWDDNPDYCNYFNHTVKASHLVDIAVQGPPKFRREAFLKALADMTKSGRRVALIYGQQDPIVNAAENLQHLSGATEAGHISDDFLHLRPTPITHFYPDICPAAAYPLRLTSPGSVVEQMAKAIDECLGLMLELDRQQTDEENGDEQGTVIPFGKTG